MTPQQAAKACMAKIEENLFGTLQSLGLTDYGVTVLEREFTEIISQACDDYFFNAIRPAEPVRRLMQNEVTSVTSTGSGPLTVSMNIQGATIDPNTGITTHWKDGKVISQEKP